MVGPDPHAAGQRSSSKWWVIDIHSRGFSGFRAIQAAAKPPLSPQSSYAAGPFLSQDAANNWISQNQTTAGSLGLDPTTWIGSWLSDLGGKLASGIEGGIVQIIKDLWAVIVGPLEVLLGVLIGLWVLVIYFKSDIMKLASVAAMAAA